MEKKAFFKLLSTAVTVITPGVFAGVTSFAFPLSSLQLEYNTHYKLSLTRDAFNLDDKPLGGIGGDPLETFDFTTGPEPTTPCSPAASSPPSHLHP